MNKDVLIDWYTFQQKYLSKSRIFVVENDMDWILYTNDEIFTIKCLVEKNSDQTENIMFVERYLNNPNIIKVISVTESDEVKEEFPEEFFEIDKEDSEGEIVEQIIERKKDYEQKATKKTSTEEEHWHYYYEENGLGQTHGTYPSEYVDHTHTIEDNKILDYNGHIHTYGN